LTEDADGPITDRPSFTPANTVVPRGRLQFETGFTFNNERTSAARTTLYDLPDLTMRHGLFNRVECRQVRRVGAIEIKSPESPNSPDRPLSPMRRRPATRLT